MHISEPTAENFFCEVCEETAMNRLAMGMDSNREFNSPIQLCRQCGPIDLELMQICREATIQCRNN
jgi:hypothetical protein